MFPFYTPVKGLRFELVTTGSDGSSAGDPFVSLSESGLSARVLLASIAVADSSQIQYVAIKLRRSGYRIPHSSGQRSPISNRVIDAQWEYERQSLLSAKPGVGAMHPAFRGWIEHGQFAPILYCAASKQFFHPPSPLTGSPLVTCRDDSLLQSLGLRPYSEGTTRYLFCAAQAAEHKSDPHAIRFWSFARTPEEPTPARVQVRRGAELFEDIWPLIAKISGGGDDPISRNARETCFAPECRIDELRMEKVVPLSFYETELFPLAVQELNFDEACTLFGGASWSELTKGGGFAAITPGRGRLIEPIAPVLSAGRQFFYGDDDSGLFPLECLLLKLSLFRNVCEKVWSMHTSGKRPHLDLKPGHAMISFSGTPQVPARWGAALSLLDLGATSPIGDGKDGTDGTVFRPPLEPDVVYSAPYMREDVFGKSELAHIIIRTSEPLPDSSGKVRGRLEIDLMGQSLRARKMSLRDVMLISLPTPAQDGGTVNLTATLREQIDGGIRCLALTPLMDKSALSAIDAMTNRVIYDREVIFYRAFSVPCDIYSLGMMLFRALLVHDGQDILAISESVKYLVGKIDLAAPRGGSPDPRQVDLMVRDHLRGDARTFNRYSVLQTREKRASNRNSIPEDVWEELLVLAFKMTTSYPGFSVCADNGDFEPESPGKATQRVLNQINNTVDRLWSELFGSQKLNREVLEVLDAILETKAVKSD